MRGKKGKWQRFVGELGIFRDGKGVGGSGYRVFQNPGNTLEVKCDIEGGWGEAITGNVND